MRGPLKPLPAAVARWTVTALALPSASRESLALLAVLVVALGALARPLRARWRPISGGVGLAVSRRLSPGDPAWYVRPGDAERVLVTALHRTRVVIARLDESGAEGLSVRRTRVLLVPADTVCSAGELRREIRVDRPLTR